MVSKCNVSFQNAMHLKVLLVTASNPALRIVHRLFRMAGFQTSAFLKIFQFTRLRLFNQGNMHVHMIDYL